jgi:quercetin dioxygenase-like cupin family protein
MEPTYRYVENLSQLIPDIQADSIISRAFYTGEDANVTLFGFAAGQELTEHTATRPAILHFIQGEADLTLGTDKTQAGPGTWVHMPPHLAHSIRAKTPVVMLLILLQGK